MAHLNECFSQNIFPLHNEKEWQGCQDAYSYTWDSDLQNDLVSLRSRDRAKLLKTSGFCPQNRCQLDHIRSTEEDGVCAEGLCYTKIENGGPSFGACCFTNGSFHSGDIIGYYNKSQPVPKPIYRHSRIVLGGNSSDTSYASFINANKIHHGIIAAQCPLSGFPHDYANTIDDMKQMILEQNITFWVQLAPESQLGTGSINYDI